MNRFKFTILLFIQAVSLALHSQPNQAYEMAKLRSDIVPHSPEAEAMAKYAVLPVTLYTGQPQVSVPVYELKTKNLSIPVSLSYNYNGFKPTEMASSIGLGWSVQGGGVITRIVKGKLDEDINVSKHYDDFIDMNSMSDRQAVLKNIADGAWDSEPDLYVFNFNGHSGKFILMKGKAYLFPYQNIRIKVVSGGFLITTEEGNDYSFQEQETTYHHNTPGDVFIPNHTSAWYLSKIISEDKTDTISYSYSSYSYHQPLTYMESFTISNNAPTTGILTQTHFDGDNITTKVLSSIASKMAVVSFHQDTINRKDLTGSPNAKATAAIVISATSASGSGFAKKLQLTHGYFSDSARLRLKGVNVISGAIDNDSIGYTADTLKYLFDYEDETASYPASDTRSIDIYGYYNNGSNAWLFPSGYFTPEYYTFANRAPNMSYSKRAILKKMTYPTGGYSTFEYEQNKKGHYNVLTTYADSTATKSVTYDSNNATNGVTELLRTFTLLKAQYVHISYYTLAESAPYPTIPVMKLYERVPGIGYQTGALLYTSGLLTGSDSMFLEPGDYIFFVTCELGIYGNTGTVAYRAYNVSNSLSDGPGLRIKKINFFDNVSSTDTALIKIYKYNEGTELSTDGISSHTLIFARESCSILLGCPQPTSDVYKTTYQSGIKSGLSQLQDEQFYYKQATEINRDYRTTGKTDYFFNSFSDFGADVTGGVFQEKQIDYIFKDTGYMAIRSVENVYDDVGKYNLLTFRVAQSVYLDLAWGTCGCQLLPTPDDTQAIEGLSNIYEKTGVNNLSSFYKRLLKTTQKIYDQNGTNPITDSTLYSYDNPDHSLPTKIVATNSKGEPITTWLKYPLDYSFGSGCSSLTSLDTNFVNDKLWAMNSYVNGCVSGLLTALSPYQPFITHQSAFTSVASSYHCESDFEVYSDSVYARSDTAWNNYMSCLASGIASNSTTWQKAVLLMQKSNIITPVIEKYVSINKSGTQYLLSATRNEYNIFNVNGSVQTVMPVAVKQTEIAGSLALSTFTGSPDTYYKPQIVYAYDNNRNLTLQKKNNDVNNSYLWNYRDMVPVASVINADSTNIAYTSFEADSKGNWSYSGSQTIHSSAPTGIYGYSLAGGDITKSGLSSGTTYIITYWKKDSASTVTVNSGSGTLLITKNGWKLYSHEISGTASITVSGTAYIDELRLYPKAAMMTTYTYNPLIGMTSQCDVNNRITYYEYDMFGRLVRIKDQDKNVVKRVDYKYQTGYQQ